MSPSRPRVAALTAAALLSALTLSACSDDPTLTDRVEVKAAADDKAPTVKLDEAPVTTEETESEVLKEGEGEPVADDALVEVDMALFNGKDGAPLTTGETYTSTPAILDLGNDQLLPGLSKAIRGSKVGGQGVAVIPPKDLFGDEGRPDIGIAPGDTAVLVWDLRSVFPSEATGAEVAPKKGLPTIEYKDDAPASVTIPKGEKAPKKLQVQPLITGEGKKVAAGDEVFVHYTGVTWKDGKVFDSSKNKGRGPFQFQAGAGQTIKAWDEGLIGQPIGSRVLIVAPPSAAYGKEGTPDGSIKPNETLVFVVDILGTTKAPEPPAAPEGQAPGEAPAPEGQAPGETPAPEPSK